MTTEAISIEHGALTSSGAWDLVRAAQAGDREAFARIYLHYAPVVSRFLSNRLVGDPGSVEDLTSETFLRAWLRLDTVHYRGRDVGAWLITIAGNLVKDHHKSARTRLDQLIDELPELRRAPAADPAHDPSPEAQVLGKFDREAAAVTVRAALAALPADQRQVVELYDLAPERDIAAVAGRMGRRQGAVKALRRRGVRSMRRTLAGAGLTSSEQCVNAVGRAQTAREHTLAVRRSNTTLAAA